MMDTVKDILEVVVTALIIAILIRSLVVETFLVEGPSMEPTLMSGERLLVSKIAYRFGTPKRGDVVVLRYPLDPSRDYIKRVVAVGGDTVELRLGRLYVNGKLMEEPYVHQPGLYNMSPITVPKGTVFVLGDHRTNSEDSRSFGPVRLELIKGKALLIIWPPKAMGFIK
ncbi:MAG: signal peptidase I [Candidatus Fermentithermobacillus carboniphilus]|uniref:Signal peptidase I n=1 Tax=Candidatus Fermentithermobacillus carboniphilus TaxID=3085328 RepID=A0AAT9LDR2_9FIRM|nr:MAG: signal peptidase I [Candidatus Fermentithermobacillus carboniphilus]